MESFEKIVTGLIIGAMMATTGLLAYVWADSDSVVQDRSGGLLSTFSQRDQLFDFLRSSEKSGWSYYDNGLRLSLGSGEQMSSSDSHSRTNLQVAGVDEMDTVKTDGKYVYVASWDAVYILNANPPTALENVSKINESYILGDDRQSTTLSFHGLFVLPQKLIVVCTWYDYRYAAPVDYNVGVSLGTPTDYYGPRTYVLAFDISDPEEPELALAVGVSGYVQTARMIADRVYLITNQYQWVIQNDTVLPRVWVGGNSEEFSLRSIYYDPEMRDPSSFLNVLAVNVSSEKYEYLSVVAGYASTIYMSKQSIFLTVQKWTGVQIWRTDGEEAVDDENIITTTIFKIAFEGLSMKAVARGDVDGWLLNQFSMDEKEPYLRLATTNMWFQFDDGRDMSSSVFVLDSDLNTVGALTEIAPTERIYSARFVEDTLYLVTFRQIDPLFVVDLKDPSDPRIVGELEMPGFSSYLHPVDETHILGIGSEGSNIKVSLYDVADPAAPFEQSKFVLSGYQYSWSEALYDHKAVLFDLERELLVIPMNAYGGHAYDEDESMWSTADSYITGALVLRVSVEDGISFRGIVEHQSEGQYYSEYVSRSLHIDDYLYTVSYTMLKANMLSDLSEIGSLVYRTYENYDRYWIEIAA